MSDYSLFMSDTDTYQKVHVLEVELVVEKSEVDRHCTPPLSRGTEERLNVAYISVIHSRLSAHCRHNEQDNVPYTDGNVHTSTKIK